MKPPIGLRWRSSPTFIVATVAIVYFSVGSMHHRYPVSDLTDALLVPVLPSLLREKANVPDDQIQKQISVLLAAYAGSSVVFSPLAGYIADRTSSRRIPFVAGLGFIVLATAILYAGYSMTVLVIGRILQGASAAVVWTVGLALVIDTVGSENLGKTIGTIFSIISVGDLIAPVAGGLLYKAAKYAGVFGVSFGILAIDIAMRLLVIEIKEAKAYPEYRQIHEQNQEDDQGDEESPLLHDKSLDGFKITQELGPISSRVPLAICFRNPRVVVAFVLALMQATFLGLLDATIPKRAEELFGFDPLKAGIIFVPLQIPSLIFGPLGGWAVDKYGTKIVAVLGFSLLTPVWVLLRIPREGGGKQIAIMSTILAFLGVGQAIIGSPSVVESSTLVEKYHKANPGKFGENGPYAQLYGINSMVFSAGLTLGPILAGSLKDSIGFENMVLLPAGLALITAILSFVYIGGSPKAFMRRLKR